MVASLGSKGESSMKLKTADIAGRIVKQDDRYTVIDNTDLKNLVVSSTCLHREKSTSGHCHVGQEEVYFFLRGFGEMELDNEKFSVGPGDMILIQNGVFHRVHNTGEMDLYFVCVFDGRREHQ
jgi:mannose-6-phosphate isomerase-like protein (cupin superfamily)